MIVLSAPSYPAIARLHEIADGCRRQRWQVDAWMLIARQEGSGSPHRLQNGGVKGRTSAQQAAQTGPRVGAASGASQAAQRGASQTATRPSASTRINAAAATPGSVHQGWAASSLISIRSALPHSRSSE
jgi:hypothetical protein